MTHRPRYHRDNDSESFELVKPLGAGGFAHTYLARVLDEELIEDYGTDSVAVKVPLSTKKQRILTHEVELNAALWMRLRELKSVHLCQYLGISIFRGQIIMVMEYCPDGSLRSMLGGIGRQIKLPVEKVVHIATGVLKGLKVIHDECVFHRDIKPENILMSGNTPKISDLGISKMVKSQEKASTTVGTIHYMSPEMLFQGGASFPSDIWSFGVTLYEMATGSFPFGTHETNVGELAALIKDAEHRRAKEVCPDIPQWLDDVINSALEKNPADRFHSADEMLDALIRHGEKGHADGELAEIKKLVNACKTGNDVEARIRSFITKYPENTLGYHCLGHYYNRCQDPQKAVDALEQGIKANPEYGSLHWNLALALDNMGRTREAVRNLETAISLGLDAALQKPAAALLKRLKGGKSHAASAKIESNHKNDLLEEELSKIRDFMNREACDNEQVALELQRLAEKYPDKSRVYLNLGEHLNRCQRHQEALEAFKKALHLEEDNVLVHWNIALACQRIDRRSDAIRHLKRAMELDIGAGLRQHAARLLRTLGEAPQK